MPVLHGIPVDCRAVLAIDFWKSAQTSQPLTRSPGCDPKVSPTRPHGRGPPPPPYFDALVCLFVCGPIHLPSFVRAHPSTRLTRPIASLSPYLVPTAWAPAAQHVVAVADAALVPVVGRQSGETSASLQRSVGRSIAAPGLCSMRVKLCVCTTSLRASPFVRGHYGTSVPCHRCWLDRSGRSFLYPKVAVLRGLRERIHGLRARKRIERKKVLKTRQTPA